MKVFQRSVEAGLVCGWGCCSHPGERGQQVSRAARSETKGYLGGRLNRTRVKDEKNSKGLGLQRVNSGTCPQMERAAAKRVLAVLRGSTGRLSEAWGKEYVICLYDESRRRIGRVGEQNRCNTPALACFRVMATHRQGHNARAVPAQ